jgi:hypothetical protein
MRRIAPVHGPTFDPRVAEALARETAAPLEPVSKVCRQELDALARDARITQFLQVVAGCRTRLRLRQLSSAQLSGECVSGLMGQLQDRGRKLWHP